MKYFFSFLLILLQLVLCAEEFDFQTSVDLIEGKWMESSIDIATLGSHPIELKRTFEPARREGIFTTNWAFSLPDMGKKEIPRRNWYPPEGCDLKYDSEGRLDLINEKDEGWLQFHYDPSECRVVSNNGDFVIYGLSENNCLSFVETSQGDREEYVYIPHPIERSFLISEKKSNNGRWIKLTYHTGSTPRDFKNGKIKELFYSEDSGESYIRLALLDYEPGITTVLDARNVKTRYRHADNKIVAIETILPDGFLYKSTELEWSGNHLVKKREKEGACQRFVYDKDNLVEESLEGTLTALGNTNESYRKFYRYDAKNRLIEEREDGGLVITYTYANNNKRPVEKHVLDCEKTRFVYDAKNRLIETWTQDAEHDPHVKTFEKINGFNFLNAPIEVCKGIVDLSTNEEIVLERIVYEYDERGRVVKESNGEAWETTNYKNGEILSSDGSSAYFSPNEKRFYKENEEKVISYSSQGRVLKEETYSHGQMVSCCSYTYNAFGQIASKTENGSGTTFYTYDPLGRKIKEETPEILSQDDIPERGVTHFSYDCLDRVTEIVFPDGTAKQTVYNVRGQPLAEYLSDGTCLEKSYYLNGQLEKETYSVNTYHHYTYDALGRVLKKTLYSSSGAMLSSQECVYAGSLLVQEFFSSGISLHYSYDGCGKIKESRCPETGRRASYHYDEKGELTHQDEYFDDESYITKKIQKHDKTLKVKPAIAWVHNTRGQIAPEKTVQHDNDTFSKLLYDALGRVEQICTYSPSGELLVQKDLRYDFKGRKTKEKLNGTVNRWIYDASGNLATLIEAEGSSIERRTHYRYISGQLESQTNPDGVTIFYSYNDSGKITTIYADDQTVHYTLFYDSNGHLERVFDHVNNLESTRTYTLDGQVLREKLANGLVFENSYDLLGRRTALILPDSSSIHFGSDGSLTRKGYGDLGAYDNPETEEEKFSYAFDGLENLIQKNGQRFTSNALNQLFSDDTLLEYDLNGNLIKKDTFSFTYDAFGRMLQVRKNDELIHDYIYDIYHRRLSDKGSILFLYDGNMEIGAADPDKNIYELRVFNGTKCVAFELNGELYTPVLDCHGSVVSVVHADTKEVTSFSYGSFGETSEGSHIPWMYANKRYDRETGLYHFGRRDYDPTICRFITPDPIGFTDGPNRYAYCHNDPLNRKDPFGLLSEPNESPGFFDMIKNGILRLFESIKNAFCLRPRQIFEHMTGHGFLLLSGYNSTQTQVGHYGKGELSPKVRVSYINGILTEEDGLLGSVKALSESHGNVNIHYVYRPTKGWVRDILSGLSVSLGFVSEQAEMLAALWKEMIDDMGGIDNGGKIIHYAHSIGAKETMRALSLLTKEQQQLVHVYAFGSPSVAVENPNYQIRHFVSIRDGIPLLDLVSFIRACNDEIPNVVFTGTALGIPLVDHLFRDQTYQDIWKAMGRTFTDWYGYL